MFPAVALKILNFSLITKSILANINLDATNDLDRAILTFTNNCMPNSILFDHCGKGEKNYTEPFSVTYVHQYTNLYGLAVENYRFM